MKQELSQLMGASSGEDLLITPKLAKLVERMLQVSTESADNDIVLDFFGGSGTTGHAAKKIGGENPMFAGDLGFRVFKLDASNIRAWEPDRENVRSL
jgi:adenine-specific DNA-methyltransferase